MISGINHITLAVHDLEESFAFYKDVLELRPVAKWYKGAYFEAGNDWICLNVDAETRTGALAEYTHIAFTVSTENFAAAVERLRAVGAIVAGKSKPGRIVLFPRPKRPQARDSRFQPECPHADTEGESIERSGYLLNRLTFLIASGILVRVSQHSVEASR